MTPDKINAVAIIRRLLGNISRRQLQLEDLWREKKTYHEQTLQLKVFEKAMIKVAGVTCLLTCVCCLVQLLH